MERRKHPRLPAQDGAIAVMWPGQMRVGQVKDVSDGGVKVEFYSEAPLISSQLKVDIFNQSTTVFIGGMDCAVAWQRCEERADSASVVKMHTCGLRLLDAEEHQQRQLMLLAESDMPRPKTAVVN